MRWRHALAGGLFVAVGFELAKRGLAWYVSLVPTYSVVYGAFATVPILLLWIYLGWVIVLLGAVIAAYAPSLQMRVARVPDAPGQRFALAVALLRELPRARAAQRNTACRCAALAAALRIDPLQVEPVLETADDARLGRPPRRGRRARATCCCATAATPAPAGRHAAAAPTASARAVSAARAFETMKLADLF